MQPNADSNTNHNEITSLVDVKDPHSNHSSSTIQVSGVIFNELPSPSNLSFHSKFQIQDSKRYKSVTSASNQFQTHSTDTFATYPPSKVSKLPSTIRSATCDNTHMSPSFDVIFVPSQTLKVFPSTTQTTRTNYNRLTSFSVNNVDCDAILLKICNILSHYSADIEYKVKSNEYCIDGVIFMTDHHSVFFMISVCKQIESDSESDQDDDIMSGYQSTIEFVRKQGDSISFTRFWCDIKQIFMNGHTANAYDTMQWIPPPLDLYPNTAPTHDHYNELNVFYQDLNADDEYMSDFMRMFIGSQLGHSIRESDVIRHEALVRTLIQQTLYDADIGTVRGALIILTQLMEKCSRNEIEKVVLKQNGYHLMKSMVYLLSKNESVLVRKYVIQLLSKLNGFCLNEDTKKELRNGFEIFEQKWTDLKQNNKYYAFDSAKDIVEPSMLDQIKQILY